MKKVLIATDKPFAPVAVKGIREVVEKAGFKLTLNSVGRQKGESGNNQIIAINCLMRNCRKYGTEPLKWTLETIKAAWPDDRVANSNGMLAGLMLLPCPHEGHRGQ